MDFVWFILFGIERKVDPKSKMSTGEEIAEKIKELGEVIKVAKQEKKPIEEWNDSLQEMLALKVS